MLHTAIKDKNIIIISTYTYIKIFA